MSALDDRRVTRTGDDYRVQISHGDYLVEFNPQDGLWWAFNEDLSGRRLPHRNDPLMRSSDVRSGCRKAEKLVAVLLIFDGERVPA